MGTTKKYKNPPLLEVVCEFKFKKTDNGINKEELDNRFAEIVKEYLPDRQQKINFDILIKADEGQITAQSTESQNGMTQFKDKDNKLMAQLGDGLLAINHLTPYSSWEEFSPFIQKILGIYIKESKSYEFEKASISCINRINIPSNEIAPPDYFNFFVVIPSNVSESIANFVIKTEHRYNNDADLLQMTLYNTPNNNSNEISFIFDLNFSMINASVSSLEEVEKWLEKGHEALNRAFEESLTDKCKNIFDL